MSERVKSNSRKVSYSKANHGVSFESVRGCPYNLFTARGIAVLSLTSSLLAMLSLIVAA